MKKALMLMFLIAAVGFVVSCGNEVTEVAWKNSADSDGRITDIRWVEDDITWSEAVVRQATSSSKEVNKTESTVECAVATGDSGSDFDAAQVSVDGKAGAISLAEGSSNVLTIKANK